MLRSTGAIAIIAVALSGCVRTTVDTTIGADDTFSQHTIMAFSDSFAGQLGDESGMDIGSLLDELDSDPQVAALQEEYPGQVEVEPYDDGELRGVELTFTDLPLDEFNATAEQTASSIGGATTITRVDDKFIVEMTSPEGTELDDLGVSESQLALLASSFDISMSFTFPGLVEEATVGEIDGNTVTLGLADLSTGQDVRIVAGASDAFNWGPVLRWGGIALALLLVVGGAIALILQDRRKHRQSALPPPVTTAQPHGPGVLAEPAPGSVNDPAAQPVIDATPRNEEESGRST